MSKQTSVVLTDTSLKVLNKYMELTNCNRNKAINEIISKYTTNAKLFKLISEIHEVVVNKGSENGTNEIKDRATK